jgi:hypothetical protein
MKQTAVEWLVDQVEDFITYIPTHISKQAKEMEKEQRNQEYLKGMKDANELRIAQEKQDF